MRLELLDNRGRGWTVHLRDLTDEALIDWLACIANHNAGDWGEFKDEILGRIQSGK